MLCAESLLQMKPFQVLPGSDWNGLAISRLIDNQAHGLFTHFFCFVFSPCSRQ